jgi:lysophospholipase L1-like esterase
VLGVLKRTYPHARIVVQSILPTRLSWIRNSTIQKINRELKQIAEREGMEYLDLYQRFVDSSGEPFPKCFDPDGIHLGKAGYDIWSEVIAEYIAYLPGK